MIDYENDPRFELNRPKPCVDCKRTDRVVPPQGHNDKYLCKRCLIWFNYVEKICKNCSYWNEPTRSCWNESVYADACIVDGFFKTPMTDTAGVMAKCGDCNKFIDDQDGKEFFTGPYFGCVLWEGKEDSSKK